MVKITTGTPILDCCMKVVLPDPEKSVFGPVPLDGVGPFLSDQSNWSVPETCVNRQVSRLSKLQYTVKTIAYRQ